MTPNEPERTSEAPSEAADSSGKTAKRKGVNTRALKGLEVLDGLGHAWVAVLLVALAFSVLAYTSVVFLEQISGFMAVLRMAISRPVAEMQNVEEAFNANCLELLSTILFAVVVLELLRTTVSYLQSRNVLATVRDFLVVGIISSVRKVLLITAHSSLTGQTGADFTQEALGIALSVLAILLLIGGLFLLQRLSPFETNRRERKGKPLLLRQLGTAFASKIPAIFEYNKQ